MPTARLERATYRLQGGTDESDAALKRFLFAALHESAATHIRQITTKDGKTKYQAQVWHKGVYYTSKTFDLTARGSVKEDTLRKAVSGAGR